MLSRELKLKVVFAAEGVIFVSGYQFNRKVCAALMSRYSKELAKNISRSKAIL
ncbi:hypothetical protein [Escherichia coli]|uniref:hypothetical protein n=1 Tax=Escherichia coli TaxID=562 RepID=UPI00333DD0DC